MDAAPQVVPAAVVFGGQPGAGKSAAVEEALRALKNRGGAVAIIGDDLRGYHPHYAALMARDDTTAAFYTDRDTGRWVEMAIEYAAQHRLNLVIEGTMRDGDKVAQTLRSLRSAGYQTDVRALAVNARLSWQGVLQRYESQKADRGYGRMTAQHSHQAAYDGMPGTIERIEQEKLADRVAIYRRGAVPIYTNELRDGLWRRPPGARHAVDTERARPMTPHELREYAEGFDKLATMLARPERHASATETGAIDALRLRAHVELALVNRRRDMRARTPEDDSDKRKVALHEAARHTSVDHMAQLQGKPTYARLSGHDLYKAAFWRGVVMEAYRDHPQAARDEKLARFDALVGDPTYLQQLLDPASVAGPDKRHDWTRREIDGPSR